MVDVTRSTLLTALRRVGLIGAVEDGYLDGLFNGQTNPNATLTIQYSEDGQNNWTTSLNPVTHSFWRWSTDNGVSFSPNGIRFKPEVVDNFGWYNYDNSMPLQRIQPTTWTTLMNNGLGPLTNKAYKPSGMSEVLDVTTGHVLFDELKSGDELYIRYFLNVIPLTSNTTYQLGHLFGSGVTEIRTPVGRKIELNGGAGVPTGQLQLDSHFFIDNEAIRLVGMSPQIYTSAPADLELFSTYISITRR